MRRLRRVVGTIAAVLVVLAAAVIFGSGALLNSAPARTRILAAIERVTGHQARIDGRIGVAWSLEPAFSIQNVVILNPPGFSRPELATARRIEARIALQPLLEGRIEVPGLWINDPDILLERDQAGRGNWTAAAAGPQMDTAASTPRARTAIDIARIQIVNGTIAWQGAPPVQLHALQLIPGGGPIVASLTVKNTPFALAGSTQAPTPSGVPFELTAVGGGLALALSGSAGGPAPQPIAFVAKTADLSTLAPLAGRLLPPLKQVVLTGQITPSGPVGLTLSAGLSDLGDVLPGLAVTSLTASLATMDQPAQFQAEARVGTSPITASASLKAAPTGTGVLVRGLRVASPLGDLAGDLALILAARPSLKGTLVSQRLDLDAWTLPPKHEEPAALPGAVQAQEQAQPTAPAPQPRWLIPDRPLPFPALQAVDADLRWTAAALIFHAATYSAAEARLILQDGRLRIDPAAITAPGGLVRMTLQADASNTTAAFKLQAPRLDAAGILAAMTGTLDLDIDVQASGATRHQMAATATGHAALALSDGEIENAALATLFGPALRGAGVPLEASGTSRLRCLATRVDATNGKAAIKTLALDTSKLRLDGDGTLDLGDETMDMHLRPTIRLGPTSVDIPVHLTGPWRRPKAGVDKGIIAPGRFGITIGAATPDPCGPALAQIRAP